MLKVKRGMHPWQGNVREFENIIERIIVFKEDGMPITVKDLPAHIIIPSEGKNYYGQAAEEALGLRERCMVYERREIMRALHHTRWNRGKAARMLKIHCNTLIQKRRKHNIPPDSMKSEDIISSEGR